MLVLGRQVDDEIAVGDDVVVKIISIRGGRVQLGIKAPPTTKIVRRELERRDPPPGAGDNRAA